MQNIAELDRTVPPDLDLSATEGCIRGYLGWVIRHARVTLPPFLTDPAQCEPSRIFVARHRDAFFLPLILAHTRWLRLAILSSGSRNGRFLSQICREANPNNVSFVRVRRGGDRNGKRRARLEATHDVLEALKTRSVLISADRPDIEFGRGAALIACRSGRPIVPIVVRPGPLSYIPLPSWDRLRVPTPLCRIEVDALPEIRVPPDASSEDARRFAAKLAQDLGGGRRRLANDGSGP